MSVIRFPVRSEPLNVPESITIYNLLAMSKAWARSGTFQINEYWIHELLVFAEMKSEVHMYQKGSGIHDHLLFWAASTAIGEGAEDRLIDVIFQGAWEDEE